LIDRERNIIFQDNVKTDKEEIVQKIKNLPPCTIAALEPVCSWRLYSEILEKNGIKTKVAHPLETKAISYNKLKNDRVDSLMLAELLRTNFLKSLLIIPGLKRKGIGF
jgi:hypothetical protein